MKVIWEASDIRGGRRFRHPELATLNMIVVTRYNEDYLLYGAVSLDDGMVTCEGVSAEALALQLTNGEFLPEELLPQGPLTKAIAEGSTPVCPYCRGPAPGWSAAHLQNGWRWNGASKHYHCRPAAD